MTNKEKLPLLFTYRNQKEESLAKLAEQYMFPLPVFHSYGHTSYCQRNLSGRTMEGCGVMDGNYNPNNL